MHASCRIRTAGWRLSSLLILVLAFGLQVRSTAGTRPHSEHGPLKTLSISEFNRITHDLSEEGGFFQSDNFTSNETSYLHVVGKLHEMRVFGGAYVGVGPEQNFTYIAKLRPEIAFIVDIRRQAVIQHLLYKALFQISETRSQFLSNLLSRPLPKTKEPQAENNFLEFLDYLESATPSEADFQINLARVRNVIQQQFQFHLTESDQQELQYVYSSFQKEGLRISFHFGQANAWGNYFGFPTLRELILQPDLNGRPGNFLTNDDDYEFVRNLQRKNRVIPVVGDFAGPKALAGVGDYLTRHGYTVAAFYTSNVEEFLFRNDVFENYVRNVRHLPIDSNSVFIRAVSTRRELHPAQVPGHRIVTILEKISVFLHDYDAGAVVNYRDLVTNHYIAGP